MQKYVIASTRVASDDFYSAQVVSLMSSSMLRSLVLRFESADRSFSYPFAPVDVVWPNGILRAEEIYYPRFAHSSVFTPIKDKFRQNRYGEAASI